MLCGVLGAVLVVALACDDGPSSPIAPGPPSVPATATLAALTLSPTAVTGGAGSTGTVTLSAAAPAGGFAVTLSSSHQAASLSASITIAAGATSGTFTVATATVSADVDATITASAGGVSRTASLRVAAPAPGGPLASFTSAHDDLIGGVNSRGTVALAAPAPPGGAAVRLASDDAAIAVPGTVTIAAGQTEAGFEIRTAPVAEEKDVRLTATFVTAASAGGGRGIAQPAAASFTILIRVLPAVPALTTIGPASGVQGTSVTVTLTGASFWDGASVAVSGSGVTVSNVAVGSATSITATFAIDAGAATGARTVTVTTAITITVSDGTASANDTFTLTVTAAANTAPTITDIANQTINEDGATSALAFTVGDQETAAGSLTVSGGSSNTTLVPTANIVFGGSGASRTVTVTPAANQNGSTTITVTVSDGTASANDTFILTVTAVNDTPTITDIADQTIDEDGATGALAFTVGDQETAAGSLTVSGSSSNTTLVPTANIVFGGSGASRTVTVTPAANQNGSTTITVTVSDGTASANDTFTLTVNAVTDTETFSFTGAQQNFTVPTGVTSITVTASGAEGGPTGMAAARPERAAQWRR